MDGNSEEQPQDLFSCRTDAQRQALEQRVDTQSN